MLDESQRPSAFGIDVMNLNAGRLGQNDPAPKRRRITRACNFCRQKKVKCDGAEPTCSTCEMHNSTCDYDRTSKKRGVPTGHFRLLMRYRCLAEYILGHLITEMPEITDVVKKFLHSPDIESRASQDKYQAAWRQSRTYAIFERLVAYSDFLPTGGLLSPDRDASQNSLAQDVAETETEEDVFLEGQSDLGARRSSISIAALRNASPPAGDLGVMVSPVLVTTNPGISSSSHEGPDSLTRPTLTRRHDENDPRGDPETDVSFKDHGRFPEQAADLLDRYFANIHNSFPLLDKIYMLQFFHENDSTWAACDDNRASAHDKTSMIWSLCALAASPDSTARSKLVTQSHAYAKQLITSTRLESACTLPRLQSLLLYCVTLVREGSWTTARESITLLCDLAVRDRLFDMTASASSGSQVFDSRASDKKAKRKAWSSCFLLDTLIALKLDVLPLIQSRNCDVPVVAEDGWEEWDSWVSAGPASSRWSPARVLSTYNQFIRLVHIFNTYLTTNTFYRAGRAHTSAQSQEDDLNGAINAYHVLYASARAWSDGLPTHLGRVMVWTPDASKLGTSHSLPPYIIGLNIAYHGFISVACGKLLHTNKPSPSRPIRPSTLDTVSRHFATSSACIGALSKVYSSHYGSLREHPFLHTLVQFAERLDPTLYHPTELRRGQIHGTPSAELFPVSSPNDASVRSASSSRLLTPQMTERRAQRFPGWFGNVNIPLDTNQRMDHSLGALSTSSEEQGNSGRKNSSVDDFHVPLFEGSAGISSLGLLNYSK